MALSPWPEALPDCPFGIFPFSFYHDAPKAARASGTSVKPLKKRPGAESIPKAAAIAGIRGFGREEGAVFKKSDFLAKEHPQTKLPAKGATGPGRCRFCGELALGAGEFAPFI